jgi:hypothetical protein
MDERERERDKEREREMNQDKRLEGMIKKENTRSFQFPQELKRCKVF